MYSSCFCPEKFWQNLSHLSILLLNHYWTYAFTRINSTSMLFTTVSESIRVPECRIRKSQKTLVEWLTSYWLSKSTKEWQSQMILFKAYEHLLMISYWGKDLCLIYLICVSTLGNYLIHICCWLIIFGWII